MSLVDVQPDPLAHFDINQLIEGSARLRPQQCAVSDSTSAELSFGDLELCSRALAGALASLGLAAGECVRVIGVPRVATVLGVCAALRAGLHVALAPPQISVGELTAFAARAKAVAALVEACTSRDIVYGPAKLRAVALTRAAFCSVWLCYKFLESIF